VTGRELEAEGGERTERAVCNGACRLIERVDAAGILCGSGTLGHQAGSAAVIRFLQDRRLSTLANRDGLTRIANRLCFEVRLREACERGARFAVCFIDPDGFKPVNDRLGHDTGTLLRHADGAMYAAKAAGKNGFVLSGRARPARPIAQRLPISGSVPASSRCTLPRWV